MLKYFGVLFFLFSAVNAQLFDTSGTAHNSADGCVSVDVSADNLLVYQSTRDDIYVSNCTVVSLARAPCKC